MKRRDFMGGIGLIAGFGMKAIPDETAGTTGISDFEPALLSKCTISLRASSRAPA